MSEEKIPSKFVAAVLLLIAVCFSLGALTGWIASNCYYFHQQPQQHSDTTTVTHVVYHPDTIPQELEPETVVGQVTFPVLSISSRSGKNKTDETCLSEQSGKNKPAETCLSEQNCKDKEETADSITLDIVQRTFGDSTYTAWVSGPKVLTAGPQLDSIHVRETITTRTITNTITIPPVKKHWHFGISSGAGLGVTSRKFDVWVGIGGLYEF